MGLVHPHPFRATRDWPHPPQRFVQGAVVLSGSSVVLRTGNGTAGEMTLPGALTDVDQRATDAITKLTKDFDARLAGLAANNSEGGWHGLPLA